MQIPQRAHVLHNSAESMFFAGLQRQHQHEYQQCIAICFRKCTYNSLGNNVNNHQRRPQTPPRTVTALLPLVSPCIDNVEQRVNLLSGSMVRMCDRKVNSNPLTDTIIEAIDAYWHTTQRQRRNSTDSQSEFPFAFYSKRLLFSGAPPKRCCERNSGRAAVACLSE